MLRSLLGSILFAGFGLVTAPAIDHHAVSPDAVGSRSNHGTRMGTDDMRILVRCSGPVLQEATTAVGCEEIPNTTAIDEVDPRPNAPFTRIPVPLPVSRQVRVRVNNYSGQNLRESAKDFRAASIYQVRLQADHLTGSACTYHMESGPFIDANKVVLLR